MENIMSKRFYATSRWVLCALLAVFICILPVAARGEASPPSEEKATEYQNYISKGEELLERGNYREAIAEFNRALLLDPASEDAKKGIIKANQKLATRPSEGPVELDRANFHLTKGTEYYDAEKFDEAIAEWEEVLRIDPNNKLANSLIEAGKRAKVDMMIEKGHDEFFAGSYDKAIEIWEEARKLVPESSTVLDDLIEQADLQRHQQKMMRINNQLKRQFQQQNEAIAEKAIWPEYMGPDGMRWKDISEKPAEKEYREFRPREEIMKELSQPVAFEFECEPLRDVLKFLTTITGINILVDEEIFERFGMFEDCYGNEVDREEIFITIHVSELPLESALNGMFRQHGLGFSIERNFIYVSTPDILRGSSFEQLETRFYHLKDTSRVSLPKVEVKSSTSAAQGGIDLSKGAKPLTSLTSEIKGKDTQELDPDYESMSVPKLVNLLRTFIPTVVDQSKSEEKARKARLAADKVYGGMKTGTDQVKLFESTRKMEADSNSRQILSLMEYDPHTNTLIVRNTPSNLDMLEVFLEHLDREPKMVALEARFITYSVLEAEKAGIDFSMGSDAGDFVTFGASSISNGATIDTGLVTDIADSITSGIAPGRGGQLLFRFTKDDGDFLQATFDLLSELKSTQTVSAPRVVTLQNKVAVINDTTQQTYLINSQTKTTTTPVEGAAPIITTNTENEFETYTVGASLSMTPMVNQDGTIRLFLQPSLSKIVDLFQYEVQSQVGNDVVTSTVVIPQIATQQIFTNVHISDGDTIVIGGLTEDETGFQTTGIPFFKDIPVIGRLFENQTEYSDRTNLMIFITVNVLDPQGVAYKRLK